MNPFSTCSKHCKLCHGPLITALLAAPGMQLTASRRDQSISTSVECHANCLGFACPGCIEKDRSSYQILNLKNHIYDYHCTSCMEEEPPSRRGSIQSDFTVSRDTIC